MQGGGHVRGEIPCYVPIPTPTHLTLVQVPPHLCPHLQARQGQLTAAVLGMRSPVPWLCSAPRRCSLTSPLQRECHSRPITLILGGGLGSPPGSWRGVFRQAPWSWGLPSVPLLRKSETLLSLRGSEVGGRPSDLSCGWLGHPKRTCFFTLLSACLWAARSWGSSQLVGARSQQVNVPVPQPSGDGSGRPGVWVSTSFSSPQCLSPSHSSPGHSVGLLQDQLPAPLSVLFFWCEIEHSTRRYSSLQAVMRTKTKHPRPGPREGACYVPSSLLLVAKPASTPRTLIDQIGLPGVFS